MANHNFVFKDINDALPVLLSETERWGAEVGSRAGRVKELTHVGITLREPWKREILLGVRKANLAAQIVETAMVISGRNDVELLGHYLPRAKDFSDNGKTWRAGYGTRMRKFGAGSPDEKNPVYFTDQLAYVVDLLRKDPLSRQAVISIWDPEFDTEPGKDIPCNDWLSFSSRLGKLDLHVAVRSNDLMWGWSGVNVFEWSALQEIVAGLLGLEIGSLHFSTTSLHLYDRHWAKAARIADYAKDLGRVPDRRPSPRFNLGVPPYSLEDVDALFDQFFQLEYDIRTGSPLADVYVSKFPEPMLRSWLQVLQWWWGGKRGPLYLEPLKDTRLGEAARLGLQPPTEVKAGDKIGESGGSNGSHVQLGAQASPFIKHVTELHNQKHAAYGDSWKRRGEMLGIMANIARKIDRLGGSATDDETSADTAIDLFVYLAKYRTWLDQNVLGYPQTPDQSSNPHVANRLMAQIERETKGVFRTPALVEEWLTKTFDRLEDAVTRHDRLRHEIVDSMLVEAYWLARYRWDAEQEADIDDYRGADVD